MTATDRVRVVLDANVFVSGAIRAGASGRLVEQWLKSAAFDVVACPELIEEVRDVLTNRQRLRRWINLEWTGQHPPTLAPAAFEAWLNEQPHEPAV